MSPEETHNYAGLLIERVTIQDIRPGRLIVKPFRGRTGIIPEREWDWDRSIDRTPKEFHIGDSLNAVLIPEKSKTGQSYYSICELSDPWVNISNYKKEEAVVGEIVSLRSYGIFVQIEPGITAVVWNENLPLLPNEIPSDHLVIGDKICGIITDINHEGHKIELSVNALISEWYEETLSVRIAYIEQLFAKSIQALNDQAFHQDKISHEKTIHQVPPLQKRPEKILLIENEKKFQTAFKERLEQAYRAVVDIAAGETEANVFFSTNHYDLVIMDIELDEGNGMALAKVFFDEKGKYNLIFCSGRDGSGLDLKNLQALLGIEIPFVYKNGFEPTSICDELIEAIENLMQGMVKKQITKVESKDKTSSWISEMNDYPFEENLERTLRSLVIQHNLAYAFLIKIEDRLRTTKLISQFSEDTNPYLKVSEDTLYSSQVRLVVETEDEIYFTYVSPDQTRETGSFRNLFPQYSYRCCFGVPIKLTSRHSPYVLVVLEKKQDYLDPKVREEVRRASLNLGTIIERQATKEILQNAQISYFKGQLLGSLIHELNNKIAPIQNNIEEGIDKIKGNSTTEGLASILKVQSQFNDLGKLFEAYSRLANYKMEDVNLNQIIEKASKQLETLARAPESGAKIYTSLDQKLPSIQANALQVEQILANLLLNAIQNIAVQLNRFKALDHQGISPFDDFSKNGCIQIKSNYNEDTQICRIIIIDSGPGISQEMKHKIFDWGFTTREEGQGMGLYVSRSLARSMNGNLYLLDTIRYVGSVFVLEFKHQN
jgi:signal transduction histidine kinase/DNA-binding NarL/FixJ family response regulator/predicted RNA-binding protein with RPS1 domain